MATMRWPDGFMWGTGASSLQTEGAAPRSDWYAWEAAGRAPRSGDGNGFGVRYQEDFAQLAELVVLAGFMRILGSAFVQRYAGRLLNIHPSLLPKYPGLDTHARALAAGDLEHGATVHYATAELDAGPAILQGVVPVLPGDTEDTLSARVHAVEHIIYPQVIGWIAAGRLAMKDGDAWLDGRRLESPVRLDTARA